MSLLANFAGVGWSALVQLACIPLYVKFLGIEAYGLIGFYATLFSVLQILDLGLSTTMNREMARYSVQEEKAGEARDLVRTLEVGYWAIGFVIGVVLLAAAPFIATRWLKVTAIPISDIQQAVMIMGALAAAQWPLSFYEGGLLGLQRQALLNGLKIVMSTVSGGGTVLILWLVSPTITAFFAWQALSSFIYVTLIAVFLWRSLPLSHRAPRFNPALIHNVWRFAAGMSGITVSALILTEMDKIILSRLLTLKMFGYYVLAGAVARWLYVLITPVFNTMFPRFSALATTSSEETLKLLYHRGSQLMAVLILPVALMIALFSYDLLLLWTRNAETARNVAPIASILVIGTALNGLMNLPYALQLAHGWTSIGLYINTVFIITLVPAIFYMTTQYGAIGAATVWVALNAVYTLIGVPLTHWRLLKGETRRWFTEDVGLPLVAATLAAWAGRELVGKSTESHLAAATLVVIFLGILAVTTLAAPQIRSLILRQLSGVRTLHGPLYRDAVK